MSPRLPPVTGLAAAAVIVGTGILVAAQALGTARGAPAGEDASAQVENVPYDGRFTFARLRYDMGSRSLRGFGRGGGSPRAIAGLQAITEFDLQHCTDDLEIAAHRGI